MGPTSVRQSGVAVGTGHCEPNSDAGYTTAGFFPQATSIGQSLFKEGESLYGGLGPRAQDMT